MPENDSIMVTPPHVAHVGSKRKMNIVKQFGKWDNAAKGPSTSHNFLK
jgi:hypothetical protein